MDDLTIDAHAHALVPAAADLVQREWTPDADEAVRFAGERSNAYNQRFFAELRPRMTDVEPRIADMDRQGVQIQAVSIAPPQYYYWTSPDLGAEVAVLENDALAELVAARPDRLVGLGTLPMHNPQAAVEELDRIVDRYGFPGVSINPSARGVDYDDPRYDGFWRRVAERGLLVVLHPNGTCQGERLSDYYLINVVGNPLETTIALARIVMGGIVERHPGIKIMAVHGGGYLTFYADRMDHAAAQRDDVAYKLSQPPSWYLKQLYFDTVVHGDGVEYLIDRVGADHVLMGSDYPYDMGHADPVGHVWRIAGLSEEQRRAVLGANAARLLGLKA